LQRASFDEGDRTKLSNFARERRSVTGKNWQQMTIALKTPLVLETDEDLVRVSRDNPGYRFEREKDGTILVSPTHTKGGAKSLEAAVQLHAFAKQAGGKAFDSSTGFAIGPQQRVFSPDASWVSQARIDALTPAARAAFWPVSPDVIIEVKSDTDAFDDTVTKIALFIERGSRYAVAIDPETREVVELGTKPNGLVLDFDAIIDA
jgi:Uma2 family endonuclease